MKVELVDHMGSDLSVVNAARVSFNKTSTELGEKDEKLIDYLAKHNHWTPFGHTSISLRVKAPIFVARQLGKHQVGLVWNEVSRRYVDDEPEFYEPTEWRGRPEGSIKQGSSEEVIDRNKFDGMPVKWSYGKLVQACGSFYKDLIGSGVAPEMARMVLPQSTYTEWIWTGSLVAFVRVCNLRLDPHSQEETRDVAEMIEDVIEPLFPVSWKALRR